MNKSENTETLVSTDTTELQQSKSSSNVEEQNNSNYFNREQIEGTPFIKVTAEGKHFIAIGLHKISKDYETIEELEKRIKKIINMDWELLSPIIGIITELTYYEIKKQETITKKEQKN